MQVNRFERRQIIHIATLESLPGQFGDGGGSPQSGGNRRHPNTWFVTQACGQGWI